MRTAIMRTKFTCKIELLFLLYSFSTALPHSGIFLMLRTKACLHHLQYDPDICSDINDHPEERNEVYRLASIFALLSEALLTLLSALIAILAGPWCDTYGYKGPLTITVVGACGTTICGFLVAFLGKDSSMWYNVLCVLPQGITGGIVLMRACCYAAITKEVDLLRALRFFALDMVGLLGRFGGVVLGWLLSHIIGHALCLLVAGFCQAGLLLFVTNNPDLMDPTLIDSGTCKRLAHLFSMTNIRAAFNIFGGNKKEDVISALKMLFVLLTLMSIMNMGPEEIMQPYTRTVLGWSVITYTWISGVGNVVTALGGILAVVCCNMVCCSALHLIAIGVFSAMVRNIIIGVSTSPAPFLCNYLPAISQGVGPPGVKSSFARLAPADETGKFLVFVTACESVMGIVSRVSASVLYYPSTAIYPGLLFIVFAVLGLAAFIVIGLVKPAMESEEEARTTATAPPETKVTAQPTADQVAIARKVLEHVPPGAVEQVLLPRLVQAAQAPGAVPPGRPPPAFPIPPGVMRAVLPPTGQQAGGAASAGQRLAGIAPVLMQAAQRPPGTRPSGQPPSRPAK